MADNRTDTSPLREFWRTVLASFSLAWVVHLVELLHALRQLYQGHQPGLYEILAYDTRIELLDATGKEALVHKHMRVQFLQNHVIGFQDYAWGDGNLFASYRCTPGVVVDRYKESDRWNILISLRESKMRGDVEEFQIERKVEDGFCREVEWFQVEIRNPTERLRIRVVFPATRRCQRALVIHRSRNRTVSLGPDHFHELPDGRQQVQWEGKDIHPLEIYTVKWWW